MFTWEIRGGTKETKHLYDVGPPSEAAEGAISARRDGTFTTMRPSRRQGPLAHLVEP